MNKKNFVFGIILVFIYFFSINVKAETPIIYGDVDGDGEVSIDDATKLDDYLLDKIELSYEAQKRGNVDGDNKITKNDIKVIRLYLAELTTIPIKMGDVNEDGVVNDLDVTESLRYLSNGMNFTNKQIIIGDVNVDNEFDSFDVVLIQRYIADNKQTLPTIEGKEIIEPKNEDNNIQPSSDAKKETEDDNQVVKVEDTLAKIPLVVGILSISLILVGGLITSAVILTKHQN